MSSYDSQSSPDFGDDQTRHILRLSPLQQELLHWLEQHTPSMVEPYLAAMTLLQGPPFPGRLPLVCFCIRDLCNILPQACNVDKDEIIGEFLDDGQTTNDNLAGGKNKIRELLQTLQSVAKLDITEAGIGRWLADVHELFRWFGHHHHFSHKQRIWPSDEE